MLVIKEVQRTGKKGRGRSKWIWRENVFHSLGYILQREKEGDDKKVSKQYYVFF